MYKRSRSADRRDNWRSIVPDMGAFDVDPCRMRNAIHAVWVHINDGAWINVYLRDFGPWRGFGVQHSDYAENERFVFQYQTSLSPWQITSVISAAVTLRNVTLSLSDTGTSSIVEVLDAAIEMCKEALMRGVYEKAVDEWAGALLRRYNPYSDARDRALGLSDARVRSFIERDTGIKPQDQPKYLVEAWQMQRRTEHAIKEVKRSIREER